MGLNGFASRYPHELSGHAPARGDCPFAGLQPGCAVDDEPFAALDAQTRETLQSELLRIWGTHKKTIVFITHSLDEAIFLSDRVAVMTQRPGRIKEIFDIDLPRPRQPELRNTQAFVHYRQRAWEALRHFKERGINVQKDSISVVGVGDMAEQHDPRQQAQPPGTRDHQRHISAAAGIRAVVPITNQQE